MSTARLAPPRWCQASRNKLFVSLYALRRRNEIGHLVVALVMRGDFSFSLESLIPIVRGPHALMVAGAVYRGDGYDGDVGLLFILWRSALV